MKYGISVPPFGPYFDVRRLASLAQEAEEAGWDGFFLWDHITFGPLAVADPWIALTAIALQTNRMRIGTLVTPLPRRRPAKVARETVTLDHLSAGRLILGVGIGAGAWEWEYLGEMAHMKARAEILDESLEVLTGMWSGERFWHSGPHFTVEGGPETLGAGQFLPPTLQKPRIPVWVAGEWPNRPPFRRAAQWDGVVPLRASSLNDTAVANLAPNDMLTLEQFSQMRRYIDEFRTNSDAFDIAITGHTPEEASSGIALASSYAAGGATWWLEDISPWRYGWNWQGKWPLALMERRVLKGPPKE